jgi:hypothetical protein
MNAPAGHDHKRTLTNLARLLTVLVEIARTAERAQVPAAPAPARERTGSDRTRRSRRDPASDRASDTGAEGNAIDPTAS